MCSLKKKIFLYVVWSTYILVSPLSIHRPIHSNRLTAEYPTTARRSAGEYSLLVWMHVGNCTFSMAENRSSMMWRIPLICASWGGVVVVVVLVAKEAATTTTTTLVRRPFVLPGGASLRRIRGTGGYDPVLRPEPRSSSSSSSSSDDAG